jgi:hypothetical protein
MKENFGFGRMGFGCADKRSDLWAGCRTCVVGGVGNRKGKDPESKLERDVWDTGDERLIGDSGSDDERSDSSESHWVNNGRSARGTADKN